MPFYSSLQCYDMSLLVDLILVDWNNIFDIRAHCAMKLY